jgi:hypothetical protein
VFLENIFATNGIFSDKYLRPCFVFKGQHVWARQLDPEYAEEKIVNDGSDLVLLGYKTEGHGVNFSTCRGKSEILSGVLLFGGNDETPCVRNEDSDVAFSGVTYGCEKNHHFPWPIEEVRDGTRSRLPASAFPLRYRNQFTIPLYVGRLLKDTASC